MNKRIKWLILFLLLFSVSALGIAIWALFFRTTDFALPPDIAPIETEQYAKELPDDSQKKNEAAEGGGKVSLIYSNEVSVDISDRMATLNFANPARSTHNVILQIIIRNEVILESGLIVAGNQVSRLKLTDDAVSKLAPGGYNGAFLIYYYNQTTGERATVNTEIPVYITVRE